MDIGIREAIHIYIISFFILMARIIMDCKDCPMWIEIVMIVLATVYVAYFVGYTTKMIMKRRQKIKEIKELKARYEEKELEIWRNR